MKPVDQSILVGEIPGVRGDCFRACIASILELPIQDVPHFADIERDLWGETQKWLAGRGLTGMWIPIRPDEVSFCHPCGDTYCVLSGKSPRGDFLHSVVGVIIDGWTFRVIHDPHPSRAGLDIAPTSALFFLPLTLTK